MRRYVARLQTPIYDVRQARTIEWALRTASERVRTAGKVTYRRGLFLATERRFVAWFAADHPDLVRRVVEMAQLTGAEIFEQIGPDEESSDGAAAGTDARD